MFLPYRLPARQLHLAADAARAISLRRSGVSATARAGPPLRPPFARFGIFRGSLVSSISPVAIFATMTAQPITSAGRRSPLGPFGTLRAHHAVSCDHHVRHKVPPSFGLRGSATQPYGGRAKPHVSLSGAEGGRLSSPDSTFGAPGDRLDHTSLLRRHGRHDMRHMAFLAVVIASLTAMPTGASEKVSVFDRFELWNDCGLVGLPIRVRGPSAKDVGLTEEDVTAAASSRLRAARLYRSAHPVSPALRITIAVVGSAYSIRLEFYKLVTDLATQISDTGITWTRNETGTHGGNASNILLSLSQHLDHFINDYLRVNKAAC